MGNVAHDLKTPLHSIEADIDVLKELFNYLPSNVVEEAYKQLIKSQECYGKISHLSVEEISPSNIINTMKSTCQFMTMAINRSQDYIKATSNIALLPSLGTLHITESISLSTTCINHLYAEHGRRAILHPINHNILCPYIITDKHWLIENVLCLLSNAMKYSDKGDAEVYIRLLQGDDSIATDMCSNLFLSSSLDYSINDAVALSNNSQHLHSEMVFVGIADHGIGITIENRSKLFQPFGQAQRMTGGTGLGLYSLSKRVEALGGSCGVESRPDGEEGSLIWFTFPYRPDRSMMSTGHHDEENEIERKVRDEDDEYELRRIESDADIDDASTDSYDSINPVTNAVGVTKPLRILLIDDTTSILKVTTRMLLLKGHTVITAMNGSQGLDKLKKGYQDEEFDLCLTDLQMP